MLTLTVRSDDEVYQTVLLGEVDVLLMYCSDGHVSAIRQTTYISFDSIWPSPHFVKQGSVVGVGCLTEVGADTWSKATSHWLVT